MGPATISGRALGAVLAVVANAPAMLPRRQPLHPRGRTRRATWRVHAAWPESGIAAFAAAGDTPVLARTSRAVGLPKPLPDFTGLALRFADGGALLFASTGTGPFTRRLLAPRVPGAVDPLTTLLPLHCRLGAVDVGAQVRGDEVGILTSLDGGPWVDRARVVLGGPADVVVRFDPLRPPVGLWWSDFWAAARSPAYALARRLTPGAP
ncbi:hypothetical protein MHY29_08110 [Micrococcus sp. ACRRV]|uniref:hypothetical protein n=1 Tax=Micrococcus sp. ACRRV TaxID=2918203 RepID=UPI001EF3185A|nr:hypothetical protein [Micrococcus sp. ACRRV]MCG7422782.1 hypothetical protein [Micrococcus sp. ACRRV]